MKLKKKRVFAGLLAMLMLISLLPTGVLAQEEDLRISTLAEWQQFAQAVNSGNTYEGKRIVLASDIALGGESSPWTPIGNAVHPFKGTFDGGNHGISGLYISDTAGEYIGLFGYIDGGEIANLTVKGSVTGAKNTAGIVGYLKAGTVRNCGNNANVTGTSAVGGVVGYVEGASIISGCYNSGNVTGTIGYIGGVSGHHWRAGTVENCYNTGSITGPATVGGVAGGHKAASPALTNCYNAGRVLDSAGNTNNVGAVVGASRGQNTNCYYIKGTGSDTKEGIREAEAIEASQLGAAFKADDEGLNNGYPVLNWQTRMPDVLIGSYEELKSFADSVNSGNAYADRLIRLEVNIDLGGRSNPWTPIGTASAAFKGTFDGNYHTISGLSIASGSEVGFFGNVNGGVVRNLVIRGSVTGASDSAGVVGKLTAGQVINCGNEATVSGTQKVGGIAGSVNGDCVISGCYNAGPVSGTIGFIGGITGQHWRAGKLENCYNRGSVTGPATVGGVAGGHKAALPMLVNCCNMGTVADSAGNANNIGAVVGASKGENKNCYYRKGSGTDSKTGITEVEMLSASLLGSAFTDGAEGPVLSWESRISTEAPVRPAFAESTERSALLAEYIKAAVSSAKANSGVTGTLLGNPDYMAGASSTATDWMALAMGRFGYYAAGQYAYLINDGTGYEDYLAAMKAYIENTYSANNGILHKAKATEWHRAVVAISALGGDPTSFGIYNGNAIDLIADGSYKNELKAGPGTQGINGWIWGLIAMDTGMYTIPSDARYTREDFITEILKMQLTDGVNGNEYGGWVLGGYGTSSDVDITAMAIQALAPYYNDDVVYTYTNANSKMEVSKTVRQCIGEALDRLGTMMNANAGFTSWNTDNVESISQVVVALCSLGINPARDKRFVTADGKTLLDGMLRFRLSNGGFCHVLNGGWNSMANDQATYALVSYWRLENGMRALYDMRDDWTAEERTALAAAVHAIDTIGAPAEPDYKTQLKEALSLFRAVPQDERRYVENYSELAAAIELVGGEGALDTDTPYLIGISVTSNPDKMRYYEGEDFNPAGMVVTGQYSDGSTRRITEYKISGGSALSLATEQVYITYGVLKTAVAIEVREKMPWDGEGTAEAPYLIKTPDDLVDLRYYVSSRNMRTAGVYFKLVQDINMKNIEDWSGIAGGVASGFRGHFDGSGYSVWNLNGSVDNANGLFGSLGDGAVIENLTIASGSLGGSYNSDIGGIAGQIVSNAKATIRNCHNYANISGTFGIGGIVGSVENGGQAVIVNCSNHGAIAAAYTGGGIIGQVGPNRWKDNGAKADISACYNAGAISGEGRWGIGGIVGSYRLGGAAETNTIQNCYNVGRLADKDTAGAIFGSAAETQVTLNNVYFLESSQSKAYGVFTDEGRDTAGAVEGMAFRRSEAEMKADSFVSVLGEAFARDLAGINQGYPVLNGQEAPGEEAPVRAGLAIRTAEELAALAERVNAGESFTDKTILLTAHIDLSDFENWTPIGKSSRFQFDGIFDGQGYVIDNLYSTSGGLFGYVGVNAVIKNVGIASGEIGQSNASFMGGVAKWSNGADFINCWNGADVYCSGYSGGIVGTVRDGGESVLRGCYNTGSVYASDGAVGGIVGHLATSGNGTSVNVTISDCYNVGSITADNNAGGIVGRAQSGHVIQNCYNVGTVAVTRSNILNGAGAIVSFTAADNEIKNCYYDATSISCGVSEGKDTTVGLSLVALKSDELIALLGDSFKKDTYALVNEGYPLLYWQKDEEAEAITDVIAKIDAIGTVTLESAPPITEARNAYESLEDELKSYVSNLDSLLRAEKELAAAQSLQQMKNTAMEQLEAYKELSKYYEEQQNEVKKIIAAGKDAIQKAENADAVKEALRAAKEKLDAVKTLAQLNEERDSENGGTAHSPQTGDDFTAMPWMILLALSAASAALLTKKRRKNIG